MNDKQEDTMTLQEKVDGVIKAITTSGKDIITYTTCDCEMYGWDVLLHHALIAIAENGLKGWNIGRNYKFECWDWTITKRVVIKS